MTKPQWNLMVVPILTLFIRLLIMLSILMWGGCKGPPVRRGMLVVRILLHCGAGLGLTSGCRSPSCARVARWSMMNSVIGVAD